MGYQPKGYPRLANLMAREKDVAIFRRFDSLNILSLLALQAEIVQLEVELRITTRADDDIVHSASTAQGDQAVSPSHYAGNFRLSRDSNSHQFQLLEKIRGKLREYISQLNHIGSPVGSQLEMLKDWLRDQNLGHPFLEDHEIETWSDADKRQYMCLQPTATEDDSFSRFVSNVLLRAYHHFVGDRLNTGETVDEISRHASYSRSVVSRISNFGTTILACIIPVLTIFVLNILPSTNTRILVTLGFTVLFATVLAVFSNAKRVEIFAATAT
ncbi:hypothetical protein BGZ61DRAFT_555030 [Ilyonectria robusta]|uniref:uncharacterized protein n=1 Tax=Ilyonectria robusta TaxID=1079257 RepID=UPI001E8D46C2|nr:uncharacterized protein BGZ61DRAFT_555030 [Ilyonectria robusta]KAH8675104.1 hypothetical protein BGZ61DRAFT_555030 [Ilyonectria robusta]